MKRILVTGGHGQLGRELQFLSGTGSDLSFHFTDIDQLDITDSRAVEKRFKKGRYDFLINCAAFNQVDRAEKEILEAFRINADAVRILAETCRKEDVFLIHFSSDYVFDGEGDRPYKEDDPVNPASAYGKSKLAGEKAMTDGGPRGMIIRTSWLYSSFGKNFVKTILDKSSGEKDLKVVNDQHGSPTYARDLARMVLQVLPFTTRLEKQEIFHYSNEGDCTWYDLASAIVDLTGSSCKITPVSTDDYPHEAPRPAYSVMDKAKIKEYFNFDIPSWKDSLAECLEVIRNNPNQ